MDALKFAKDHPLVIGGGVFLVGLFFLMSRNSGAEGDGGMSAFYAAQAAQKSSGDAVQIATINAQAGNTRALAYLDTQKSINTLWAGNQVSINAANNAAALAMAPYDLQNNYLATIGAIASLPPITQTSTSSSGNWFGKKNKTSTTVVPNPAWAFLENFSFDPGG